MESLRYDQHQRGEQKQKAVLNQAMRRSLSVLEMDADSLGAYLLSVADQNCLLEVEPVFPQPSVQRNFSPPESENLWSDVKADLTLQLHLLCETQGERRSGEILLDQLDENGYLPEDAVENCVALGLPKEEAQKALKILQSLEPRGIGGRSLREVLLLQLDREDLLARQIVKRHLPLLADGDMEALKVLTGAKPEAIQQAVGRIKALQPRPLQNTSRKPTHYVQPELLLRDDSGELVLSLVRCLPEIRVSSLAAQAIRECSDDMRSSLWDQYHEARELTDAVARRNRTLLLIADALVRHQQAYFRFDAPLVPLTMREIAEELGLSISTVSRTVSSQSLQYRDKTCSLKGLFTASTASGASREQVMQAIQKLVASENSRAPRSDGAIARTLSTEGMPVSRRTITKYRTALGIPPAADRMSVP